MTFQRELSTACFSGNGEDFFTDTTGEKNRARIEGLITDEQSRLAGLDLQAEELIHRRYAADAACAQGLASEGVLGATAQFTAAAIATATPEALLAKLALLRTSSSRRWAQTRRRYRPGGRAWRHPAARNCRPRSSP